MSTKNFDLTKIAQQYSSAEEFKEKDLPNYLKAKQLRIVRKVFPPKHIHKPITGIYYLIAGTRITYIGYSLTDMLSAIESHTEGTITYDRYKYHTMNNDADIVTLATYLVNKLRPSFNTNVCKTQLSFTFPKIAKVLGPATKVTL